MTLLSEGKIAVVTGASSGLGQGIAKVLAREGADLLVTYRSNRAGMDKMLENLKKFDVKTIALQADIAKLEDIDCIIDTVLKEFGRIDILVNNAGITNKYPFLEITEAEYDNIFAINCKGTYFATQKVAKIMVKQKYGKIINISSLTTKSSMQHFSAYSATKAAMNKFTEIAAVELAPYNIQTNAIAAGWILVGEELSMPEEKKMQSLHHIPINRFCTPEDIGELTVFLASERSNYITGQTIFADGGQSLLLSMPLFVKEG